MSFSEDVIRQAWQRSGSKCECRRSSPCRHWDRCNQMLKWESQGKESDYGWEAHHVNANGPDALSNCEILCQECHKNTQSYGG